jgi:hypothetical protein
MGKRTNGVKRDYRQVTLNLASALSYPVPVLSLRYEPTFEPPLILRIS